MIRKIAGQTFKIIHILKIELLKYGWELNDKLVKMKWMSINDRMINYINSKKMICKLFAINSLF